MEVVLDHAHWCSTTSSGKIAAEIAERITETPDHQSHRFLPLNIYKKKFISMLLYGIPLQNMIFKSEYFR